MIRKLFAVCALSVFLGACQGQQEAAIAGSVYSDQVVNALQQRRDNDNKKRASLTFDSGATAQTCGEYLRLMAVSVLKEDVNNQIARSEYLLCDVLAMIAACVAVIVNGALPKASCASFAFLPK